MASKSKPTKSAGERVKVQIGPTPPAYGSRLKPMPGAKGKGKPAPRV